MRRLPKVAAIAVVAAFAFAAPIGAHHGALEYDTQHETTVLGATVTRFEFRNPHVQIFWDTKDGKGAVQMWAAQTTQPEHTLSLWVDPERSQARHPTPNGFG